MKNSCKFLAAALLGGMMLNGSAMADEGRFTDLSASWWQWALSVPTTVNPLADQTGANCMIGQQGKTWFLAGLFGSGTVHRSCSIPAGKSIFLPVYNWVNINTPNVCGQDGNDIAIADLRSQIATSVEAGTRLLLELDGVPVHFQRAISPAFVVALPEDNLFDAPCASATPPGVPAGVYQPAVSDGYWALIKPLKGSPNQVHTLHIHSENLGDPTKTDDDFILDVTYDLTSVPGVAHKHRRPSHHH